VPADVVERPDLAVLTSNHDDRRVSRVDLFGEIVSRPGDLLHPTHLKPRPLEDGLPLEVVELRRDRILIGHRLGAELRVMLGPAALGGLREASHDQSSGSAIEA
jgi:hypothetical protein